jgi:uncharacterized protein (DUF1501 family)
MTSTMPHCPGPQSRRQFLKMGALTLAASGVQGVVPWKLRAQDGRDTLPDTSVILIWLPGGPPHMEMYDMKPDAPAEYRGEFRPVHTVVAGIDVCEYLPLHTRVADRFTIIRSIAHSFADHGGGHKRFLTGRDPRQPDGFVNDHPMVGSMVAQCRLGRQAVVPNYVAGIDRGRDGIDVFSFGSAYLGPATHPFMVSGDPSEASFQIRNLQPAAALAQQLDERLTLLNSLDMLNPATDASGGMDAMDTHRRRALGLLNTPAARRAFDLSREPIRVRERYGMHRYGQRALMARRLVEAGASFVTMVMENPSLPGQSFPQDVTYNWDSHAVNCHIFTDCRYRFPMYDRAVTALIEDLYARGLDKKVMLIVTGEFGRTPRISYSNGRPGRDHWPQAMSLLVSGGGFRMGQVIGSTNARGEAPRDRPLTPNDLWATMFRHLGIDHERTSFLDHSGRPMPILPYGTPIAELG